METTDKRKLTREEIRELVRSLPRPDWELMRFLASLSSAGRVGYRMKKAAEQRAILKEEFRQAHPDLADSELNMMVLRHLTDVRMPEQWPPEQKTT